MLNKYFIYFKYIILSAIFIQEDPQDDLGYSSFSDIAWLENVLRNLRTMQSEAYKNLN